MKNLRLFFGSILVMSIACSLPARDKPIQTTPTNPSFEPPNTESIPCSELGGLWTGGEATARPGGNGYDVSNCVRSHPMKHAEMVKPAERDAERWGEARCNDGTPFGFSLQLSPSGQSDEWLVYLEGGGFCDDNALPCSERGKRLSSTPPTDDRAQTEIKQTGIFNRNPSSNPDFYDANIAFAYYCSSDGWSGGTTEKRPTQADPQGWYFSGHTNVRAMIEILIERYGLDDSDSRTRLLFAGSSAGGIGVEVNANVLAQLLPNAASHGRLKLLDDGGFITDFDDPLYRPGDAEVSLRELIVAAYDFWGASLNPRCEAAQVQAGEHPGRCFLSAVVYPYITHEPPEGYGLTLLIQYSAIDDFALNLHGIDNPNDPADAAALERWRADTLSELENIDWVFSGGDRRYHTILPSDEKIRIGPNGKTFLDVLGHFWDGNAPMQIIFGNP